MKKYMELGFGNRWLLRTEIEMEDGTECEHRGVSWPTRIESCYIRIWIGKTVLILDTREGIKVAKKKRNSFKFLLGIVGT